jgi:mono/diheme cytochrome c family protein
MRVALEIKTSFKQQSKEQGMNLTQKTNRRWLGLASIALVIMWLAVTETLQAQQTADDLYGHKCAVCHGQDGLGNTAKGKKVHVKDVHTNMKDSEADMIKVVTDGKGDDMDSYKKDFTAEQIKAVVEYYRSLGQK